MTYENAGAFSLGRHASLLSSTRKVSDYVSATCPCRITPSADPARSCAPAGIGAVAGLAVAPIPDLHEDTPRCAVSPCPRGPAEHVRYGRGDLGTLFAFARRPPPLAATWRAPCGSRLGFARRVPKPPHRPPVADARQCGHTARMARASHARSRGGAKRLDWRRWHGRARARRGPRGALRPDAEELLGLSRTL